MLNLDKQRQALLTNLWDALIHSLLTRIQEGKATAGDLSVARHVIRDAGLRAVMGSQADLEVSLEGLPDFDFDKELQ